MRALGRMTLILLVGLPLLMLGNQVWDSLRWNELAAALGMRLETAVPSTSYLPVDDNWLEFTLSGAGHALRVRTNGVVDAQAEYQPGVEWWYAFEYRLLGTDGQLLRQGEYHHRTRLTRFRNPDTGRLESKNIVLDPDVSPTDGRSMVVYFGAGQLPTRVQIRPIFKDPGLLSLMFRVYEQIPNPKHQLGYLWQRLAQGKKTRLAQGSVYGLDLLLEKEKQNLLRYDWKAIGPVGVEHEQYELTKLYISRASSGVNVEENQIPYGLYCDRIVRGMIPLPAGDWEITLEVLNINEPGSTAQEMTIRWYGENITERWQTHVPSSSGTFKLGRTFNSGQLEILASAPLIIRARGTSGDIQLELTPKPLHVRTYLVDSSGTLNIDIDHVAEQSTPFRVDIRAKLESGEPPVFRTLSYEFLDVDEQVVRSGQLAAQPVLSNYDRLAVIEPGFNISEPVRYYFNLPKNVAGLRFSSQHELLLATYTRPAALSRNLRVPEDYQAFGDDQEKQPGWFLLRPVAEEKLRREFKSTMIAVQRRPPATDPKLLSGDYDWQLYQPVGNWRARHLLIPRTENLPVRDQSLAAVYRAINGNQPEQILFRNRPGRRDINPDLLYLRERATPLDIKVLLNNRPFSSIQIAGRQGELQLPPVSAGTQQLTILAAEPVRWLINHAAPRTPAFLKRLAMQITSNGLEFEYEKTSHDAEMLLGKLYSESVIRSQLRVVITGAIRPDQGPWQEWTFLNRLFDLRKDKQRLIPVLNSDMKSLSEGQRFFLPLGADLPPGKYRIHFILEGATEAYLTLYRLTPGRSEFRTLFREMAYAPDTEL